MTYAPQDLKDIRDYVMRHTGITDFNAMGIVGDPAHAASGGYHEGNDDLARVGRLDSDYSKRQSPRDRPGSNAASAMDIGQWPGLHAFSNALAASMLAGDHRLNDIRELIYTPDGRTVRRVDRLGKSDTGDSSHLTHSHLSFFRDSEGRRSSTANFYGWLVEYLEGKTEESFMAGLTEAEQRDLYRRVTVIDNATFAMLTGKPGAEYTGNANDHWVSPNKLGATVDQIAASLTAAGGSPDLAPVVSLISDLASQVADLAATVTRIENGLHASGQAQADALR